MDKALYKFCKRKIKNDEAYAPEMYKITKRALLLDVSLKTC